MNDLLRKDLYEYYKIIYKDGKTIARGLRGDKVREAIEKARNSH